MTQSFSPLPFIHDQLYIIAEIGSSHRGDRPRMRELIHAASESGANCVKTQWIYAEEILPPNAGKVTLPNGHLDIFQQFKKLEVPPNFYEEMKELTENLGMDWTASPFGLKSAAELIQLNPHWIKVASPEINHFPLLTLLKSSDIPIILSTGVSTLKDIQESLNYISTDRCGLMHCITSYPAPEEEYNLKVIQAYKKQFSVFSGLSDHSLSPVDLPLLAASVGAKFLEKHFTLEKGDGGMDDPIALDPKGFQTMVQVVRQYEGQTENHKPQFLEYHISSDRQKLLLGDGNKTLSPSEKKNYHRTNRSIHALRDILPGESISETNAAILRTEKVLRPGLHPREWKNIQGLKAIKRIPSGEGILLTDLEEGP